MSARDNYTIAIIGGGILGTCVAYFLSYVMQNSEKKVVLVEQEDDVARHTSSRNTGKVHAPFLYNPSKKQVFAKAASIGFDMLKDYCNARSLPFKQDGVLEVATYDKALDILDLHLKWGYANGLQKNELKNLGKAQVYSIEPHVKCLAGLYCSKDASVNYGAITKQLIGDARRFGCKIVTGNKATKMSSKSGRWLIHTNNAGEFTAEYIVNTAGGNSVDIAHSIGVATSYTDIHFRGEYWQAPPEYHDLTQLSIYSVPKYPDYPFLDPHWIVRVDGRREIGPNAVPVFSPYAYNWGKNLKFLIPKIYESSKMIRAHRFLIDKEFISLASNEIKSFLSKTAMINRAREFLPEIEPSMFITRGTIGIRSILIDKDGKFVPDTMIIKNDNSLHVLNYNSPGATGALPIAAMIANQLIEDGTVKITDSSSIGMNLRPSKGESEIRTNHDQMWDISTVSDRMKIRESI